MHWAKADNLKLLLESNFNVPSFIVRKTYSDIHDISTLQLDPPFILRSSFSCEDSSSHAFAWIFESYAPIYTHADLKYAVNICEEQTTEKYTHYKDLHNLDIWKLEKKYILQEFIVGDFSGVCFTKHHNNECYFEIIPGINEPLVQWEIKKPFCFGIDRETTKLKIYSFYGGENYLWVSEKKKQSTRFESLFFEEDILINFSDLLYKKCREIEWILDKAQDIEFTVRGGTIYILQSRDITSKS